MLGATRKVVTPVTNRTANQLREDGCIGLSDDFKLIRDEAHNSFIWRTLYPWEWHLEPANGTITAPKLANELLLNEVAVRKFVSENTDIPVPKVHACYRDNGSVVFVEEDVADKYAPLSTVMLLEQRMEIEKEVSEHLAKLKKFTSDTWGGPTGIVLPPYRAMRKSVRPEWNMKKRPAKDLVFCHNNLSTHCIFIDPWTRKVKAISGWGHAGFYPPEFEAEYFRRLGPMVPLEGEVDDRDRIIHMMEKERKVPEQTSV